MLDPGAWGVAHADALRRVDPARAARLGAWATPPDVAAALARDTLSCAPGDVTVVDPFCGGGSLLVAAARALWVRHGDVDPSARAARVAARVRGWDIDADAVVVARRALSAAAGVADIGDGVVAVRDTLLHPVDGVADVVVTNPPWVGADALAAEAGLRASIAARFPTARGNWDLFVPATEVGLRALRPGGVLGVVLPDRVVGAAYASVLRQRLHGDARSVTQLSTLPAGVFPASVHAVALVSVPGPGGVAHLARDGRPWRAAPVTGPTLADVATVCGAATVAEAYAWRDHLVSGVPDDDHLPVVNTGTIDPGVARWAEQPLRYLGRKIATPVIPAAALGPRRLAQARAPKLIVAGLSRRLEVLPDPEGRWVGLKSTVLVLPHDPVQLPALAAWLDSDAATDAYLRQFPGTALRGGYVRVGVWELGQLALPDGWGTT